MCIASVRPSFREPKKPITNVDCECRPRDWRTRWSRIENSLSHIPVTRNVFLIYINPIYPSQESFQLLWWFSGLRRMQWARSSYIRLNFLRRFWVGEVQLVCIVGHHLNDLFKRNVLLAWGSVRNREPKRDTQLYGTRQKIRQGTHNASAKSLFGCHNANLAAMNEPQSCPITICPSQSITCA